MCGSGGGGMETEGKNHTRSHHSERIIDIYVNGHMGNYTR